MRNQYRLLAEKYKLVNENEDEDLLAGVNKVADLVDPKGKVVYGEMEIDYGGEFASLDAYIITQKNFLQIVFGFAREYICREVKSLITGVPI